jgi:hypothetical protein
MLWMDPDSPRNVIVNMSCCCMLPSKSHAIPLAPAGVAVPWLCELLGGEFSWRFAALSKQFLLEGSRHHDQNQFLVVLASTCAPEFLARWRCLASLFLARWCPFFLCPRDSLFSWLYQFRYGGIPYAGRLTYLYEPACSFIASCLPRSRLYLSGR